MTEDDGRRAGELLGATGTSDPIDASVALLARRADQLYTSDPGDLRKLCAAFRRAHVAFGKVARSGAKVVVSRAGGNRGRVVGC
jgi:hypothetical protein